MSKTGDHRSPIFYTIVSALSGLCLSSATVEAAPQPEPPHNGKAGVYMRMSLADQKNAETRTLVLANPSIDCILLNAFWADLEPEEGVFKLDKLKQDVANWTARGKHVVVHLALYGQATDNRVTPAWIYKKKDVRSITFIGGGIAKGSRVTIPAVWDEGFNETHLRPLVSKLATEFDGDNRIWYIHPAFGHLGHITAQPSRDGAKALPAAGWTAQRWTRYCLNTFHIYRTAFKKTPLMVSSSPLLIRDKKHLNYEKESLEICQKLASEGAAVQFLGLTADTNSSADLVHDAAKTLSALAKSGCCRIGFGDDWPMWVPENRRDKPPTIGFDDSYFKACLNNAFTAGATRLPTTMLYLNPPEALATSPLASTSDSNRHAVTYQKAVVAILEKARQRLFENDKEVFSKASKEKLVPAPGKANIGRTAQ